MKKMNKKLIYLDDLDVKLLWKKSLQYLTYTGDPVEKSLNESLIMKTRWFIELVWIYRVYNQVPIHVFFTTIILYYYPTTTHRHTTRPYVTYKLKQLMAVY